MFYSASVPFIRLYLFILCTTYFINANSVIWTEHFPRNVTRYRRQTNTCGDQLQCKSGECISEDKLCDGKEDCKDGLDETECEGIPCNTPYLFRCAYGGCVSKLKKCDGNKDCKDNSDEIDCPNSTSCGLGFFQCKDGQCIEDTNLCDGIPHCKDESDETKEACGNVDCPGSTYRCAYGACVSINSECNGIKECFDGSDETGCPSKPPINTPTPTPPTPVTSSPDPNSCVVPPNPEFGSYSVADSSATPGISLPPFSALLLKCNNRYYPDPPGNSFSLCLDGSWKPSVAKCSPGCRSMDSTETTNVVCNYKGMRNISCQNPIEGYEAHLKCVELHEEPSLELNPYRRCKDFSWDNAFPKCYPVCGQKRPKGVPQIIGGVLVQKGSYPWHAGIFDAHTKENLCGGSILNDHIILSAAHCFSDLSNGRKKPKENYLVAAGKYYRFYDDKRDVDAQTSKVKDIHIPIRYKGEISQYAADIAVVVLETKLTYTTSVQPVCIDWANNYEYQQLFGGSSGVVVGWGQTVQGDKPSEELKELILPVIPYERCFEEVPKDFRRYLTHDKVCAGFLEKNQATCQGDSGGGLVFQHTNDRYFIRGIVSTSPATVEKFCDSDQYTTYTLVSQYTDFIRQFL